MANTAASIAAMLFQVVWVPATGSVAHSLAAGAASRLRAPLPVGPTEIAPCITPAREIDATATVLSICFIIVGSVADLGLRNN